MEGHPFALVLLQPVFVAATGTGGGSSAWVPIAIAGLGLVGTALSPLVTQLLAQRAEARRREADRRDQAAQWSREDTNRWLLDRRSSYVNLVRALEEIRRKLVLLRQVEDAGHGKPTSLVVELDRAIEHGHMCLAEVHVWGAGAVGEAADATWDLLWSEDPARNLEPLNRLAREYGPADEPPFKPAHDAYKQGQKTTVLEIRTDLGLSAEGDAV